MSDRRRDYCFGCFSSYIHNILALQYAVVEYNMVSGHSHTLVRVCTNTADVIARVQSASAEIECSCTVSSRRSTRGMCSMNTSSL